MVEQTAKHTRYPVDPAKYPLSDPSHGPTYSPGFDTDEQPLWWKLIVWVLMGAGLMAAAIVGALVGFWVTTALFSLL